jgi:glycosyltransferase involved in cell wall biosynthesis
VVRSPYDTKLRTITKLGVGVGKQLTDTLVELDSSGPWAMQAHELIPGSEPVATPPTPKQDKQPKDPFNILLLGRVNDPLKGYEDAVYAVVAMKRGFPFKNVTYPPSEVHLTMLGVPAPDVKDLQTLTDILCDTPQDKGRYVKIEAFADDDATITNAIRAADALIMPSLVEGFGLVALEALEEGIPILVCRYSGMAEFLLDSSRVAADVGPPCVVQDMGEAAQTVRPLLWARDLNKMKGELKKRYTGAKKLWELLNNYRWEHAAQALVDAALKAPASHDTKQGKDGTVLKR